ncbi:1-acylglycerol-3-phosphate O-acyltransferase 5 [Bombyx mori]|uniref:1-acyl-sn-glycerol-3-phosphate acyltransferase n=2 Tax=Bombyx TaxID=7090 RepID=M4M7Y0_BOMMO|nr:1-acylglycerol-3-phosphate O-acyltransferase 5 [Bombyx mori]AGG55025.1 acyltransferase AGPAT5 [Bombyx mori]
MWHALFMSSILFTFAYLFTKITDREPNKIKYHFYFISFYVSCCMLALVMWPLFLFSPKNVRNTKWAAKILKHVTKIMNLKWELRNGEILAEERGAVVVSNHQYTLDVLGMFNIWDVADRISAIAKKELFYVWPFGLSAYLAGVVFIDRYDPKEAYKQLQVTSEVMTKNKTKIWIFPEGTRNKNFTKFLPFKKGAFNIAVSAQVPVIPVVYSPYYFINPKKHIFNKGHVIMQCLEPIPTKGLTMEDVPILIQKVYEKMTAAYKELSKEVLSDLPPDYAYSPVG